MKDKQSDTLDALHSFASRHETQGLKPVDLQRSQAINSKNGWIFLQSKQSLQFMKHLV